MENFEGHDCGSCFFCLSKCPECGSTDVHVKFNVAFEYSNDTQDRLSLDSNMESIEMECFGCNAMFSSWDGDEKAEELGELLTGALVGHETWINIDSKREISIERYKVEMKEDDEGNTKQTMTMI